MKTASQPDFANDALKYAINYVAGDPIPAAEVFEDDPAASWLLWDETVNHGDFLQEMRCAAAGPAPLSALG